MPLKGEMVSNSATAQELDCDVIAISYGFTPDLTIPGILKLKTVNKEDDEIVMVDSNQRSSKLEDWMESKIAQCEQSVSSVVKAYLYDEFDAELKGMDTLNYDDLVIGK